MKTKWLFTSVFFLVFCMSAYGIQVSAPDLEAEPGDAITVEISVDDATGIAGADFKLNYDPAILEAKEARLTDLATGLTGIPNLAPGEVTMSIVSVQLVPLAEGSGALIEVDFDVLPDASGVSPLTLSEMFLYDEFAGDLDVEVVNGSVTVAGVRGTDEVFLHHMEAVGAGDVDEIMADYAEDAAILGPDGALRGHDEIRPFFESLVADILPPGSTSEMVQQVIEGEIAYIVWSAESDNYSIPFGSDTFIVRDGSITTQTFAARMLPKVGEPALPPTLLELPESPEKDVLMHHLDAIGVGDVDAIMADYAEDAILITPDGVLRGPAEIRPLFEGMVADVLPPGSPFLMIQQIIEGEVAYIVWSAESANYNIPLGTDTFIIRDGKIVTQTFAAQMEAKPPVIDTEANKALVSRLFDEAFSQGNLAAVDEVIAPDFVHYTAGKLDVQSAEEYKLLIGGLRMAFPDATVTVEDMIAAGDKVTTRQTYIGTHEGALVTPGSPPIPPTGAEVLFTGICTFQIVDGMIVEGRTEYDQLGLMQQLGVISPPREAYDWGAPSEVTGAPGDPDENKAVVLDFVERFWNQKNVDVLDEFVNPEFVNHTPVEPGSPLIGIEVSKQAASAYTAAFPDMLVTVDDLFAEGDKVVERWIVNATHQGEIMGIPPSGNEVLFTGYTIYRFADSKMVEMWWAWDALGLAQQITPPAVPETEANKALVRRVYDEIWNQGAVEVADELFTPDYAFHGPGVGELSGPEAFKQLVIAYRAAFPDIEWIIEDQIAEEDMVVNRITGTGTHQGEFAGVPPTNEYMTATLISIIRIADGKIQESWNFVDMLGVMQQMGVADAMGRETYVWGPPSEVVGDPGDPEANKVLVERYVEEAWNQQNLDVLDELMNPDMVNHEATLGLLIGIEAHKQGIGAYLIAFPDFNCVIDDIIAEGDKVVTRWTCTGTHQGELVGIPPSGKQATWTGSTISRIADGKIVEMWWAWDALGLMQQITPTEPEPALPEVLLALLAVGDGAFNSQDPDLLVSFSADDLVYDYVPTPPPIEGKEAIKEFFAGMFQTFPDLSVALARPPLVAGNIAVAEHIMTGTHLGELDLGPMGKVPATGKSIQTVNIDIWEFEGDEAKKVTTYDDMAGQLMQLGILPAAELPELVPSFELPEPEAPGLDPVAAAENGMAVFNSHDAANYAKLFQPDADIMLAPLGVPMDRDAFIASIELYFIRYSDIQMEPVRIIDMGDGWVLVENMYRATNDGPFLGIPATGNTIELRGAWLGRFDEGGLMTNAYVYWDELTVLTQLGLFPPPAKPPLPEVLPVGHHTLDIVYESVQDFASVPEERPDGLYLVSTQEAIFDAKEVILTFDDGTVLELTGRSRGEHQELKVMFDDAGVPVNAVGASYGTLEIFGPQDEVLFRGAYTAEDEAALSPEFQALGFSSKVKSVTLGQGAYDGHTCTATGEINLVPDPDDPEKLILLGTGDAVLDKIITTKPPTGSHTSEAWYRRVQDPGIVPEQREDGLYLVSTRQTITSVEGIYTFDTGEEVTTKSIAWGERQEFKVIFDENGVPVRAVGGIYGLTMKGSDSYGNISESVVHLEYEISLSPDMQITGLAGEGKALTQLTGKFANYINVDNVVVTLEPDPENPTEMAYHAVGSGETTEVTGLSSVGIHSMQLQAGLNMLSVPLKPLEDYTARSLAEELGATVVIRYDKETNSFVGFTPEMPGDGYAIEAGVGYIVNVLKPMEVEFMGTIWGNVSLPEVEAAPPLRTSAWAFVVSGSVLDGEGMSAEDGGYMLTAKNLRTGATAIEKVDTSGYFAAIWADLSRKAVAEAGDKVEVAVIDSRGKVVSGPFVHDITLDGIRNAVVKVQLRLGDIIPEKSALLQNYPNPFNPETWIPFHLKSEASVSIRIFNLSGQLIKTLDLGHKDAGVYVSRTKAAYWDGKNEAGEEVASGIYFYSINAGDFSSTRKMIIRK